ncbi:hydrogenase nickel incorporation protein HypB [Mesoterricola silvestris]|uniref:Hydrogenase accessory protein HypB n=1 Tax=Mesoterricola silvestris TaxID=2927979 RepID=A0AA48GL37_9BACT|nr:hydrogenase nickel incorporation protein HypB [Mesoterricola silvestris]BDU73224.1 hydrogenase accessory protein HypB [Mesoterricola silvestris]
MCTTCGCGGDGVSIGGKAHSHDHPHPAPGTRRRVVLERDLLAKNNLLAADNRAWFAQRGILALNLVSSPGSGKTTLLVETIRRLAGTVPIAVIEGDQQTSHDADRIRAAGAPAIQINTGKGCHLDAHMVGHAAAELDPPQGALLLVENVGNLVCPAAFDLGEAHKVVILSVTEGEDKPFKYPDMFIRSDVMVVNKIDLLPYLAFDVEQCVANALKVNPALKVIRVSATSGEGLEEWTRWIVESLAPARA